METDDWEFSAEELEFLERDALNRIAQRNATVTTHYNRSPSPLVDKVNSLPTASGNLTAGTTRNLSGDDCSKTRQKVSVKFFLHASGYIAAKCVYDQVLVGALRKIPKATWNAKERLWMFPLLSLSSAEKVIGELNGSNIEVEALDPLLQRAISAASTIPDLRDRYDLMPDSIESKLLPFQREGVRFVLQHGGRVLLADEMGLGKTLQAIAVASCVRDSWPVLVLTPSSLRLQWASMIQQWLGISSSDILVVLSNASGSNKGGFTIMRPNTKGSIRLDGVFNIVSYDAVDKLQGVLMNSDFKVVIADESHYLKNAQAKRTSASLPILQKAHYTMLLTGTPALSRPIELYKQLEALYPNVYKSVHEYGNRYCQGGVFGMYQGASNHEELHNLMKATVMIRRLKKDVLTELPVKRRQQVFLDLADKDMKQINALFRELELVKSKIKASNSKEEAESLKFTEKNIINKIYTESAAAKIPAVLDYLGTVIEAGCKFIVFAHHQPMIDSIHQFLLRKKVGCIRIDGGTPAGSRQSLVTDFQDKDAIKAAVLSIKAGGVGLTLTAASTVIFAELSWTPGDIIQAEDRAHRIGQASSVNVYYLLANDTVDDIIWDVVQSKLENLGQMLDGHEKSLEVSVKQPRSSPAKQKTLDSFVKRCNSLNSEQQSDPKHQRH
ncbi:SWI/SNF-related matrix-associated actin-dependent regulator of chromatin subfamily A-like protein 1 isoform X1 [Cynara cardunculus var. scolymus]|uniref:SWI/SNF-related matrix-associated actin-dependent regulator of chromatin subfamily A-like protein 1 isoform X1 n=1 Tax=Cynara cardunculus var. scolymus TaxID=59895 RepID=UPI000D6311A4|nr:SWI/SNF-related matrix-associated actin-dependent regulator of chromatin subfamily A-like protein 1 isoform X1 [Cynara cardunculus var. scolymus]